jgi:LmbE family N-acetylglucosaminyl deacetylase
VRVLAVGAHPDDLEILCAGTLARYVAEGHEVVMCHVARGDRGTFEHSREEITRIRHEEARRAAAIAGAGHATLDVPDAEVDASSPQQRAAMVQLVREAAPDVLLTHASNDYMTDHNETSRLVFDASFMATLPRFETASPHHPRVTPLYFMETVSGLGFEPTEFVDISSTIDTKLAMFEAHRSQLDWLRDHDGVDMLDNIRTSARYRGQQCGVSYAEAFAACNVWLRATTRRLLP